MAAKPKEAAAKADGAVEPEGIYVDGKPYTIDKLTFRERAEMRKRVCELLELEPNEAVGLVLPALPEEYVLPVMVWVIKRRTDPGYEMKDALELNSDDLEKPADPPKRASQ
jgi:hypothetical protein